jgi:hypothetical protein
LGILLPDCLAGSVENDAKIPQSVFAAQALKHAFAEAGRDDLKVTLTLEPDETSAEALRIRSVGPNQIQISDWHGEREVPVDPTLVAHY